ncbi:hypothetical protein LCGC14_2640140 [marine sediment metagenome]|uniref:Tyr recombinase domain-containing protein n=1 Tax=marine sediment metagenome TaxID=412755 RepID=A0A0F8ZXM4_9ZZZZ
MTLKVLDQSEIERLNQYFDQIPLLEDHPYLWVRNRLIAFFMLDAGLRAGEVVQLTFDSVFCGLTMNDSISLSASTTKSKRARIIPMTTRLGTFLHIYVNRPSPPLTITPFDYLFPSGNPHRHLTTRQVHRICTEIGQSAFGRPFNPHQLRHTFATRLMRVSPIRVVQELLGHGSLSSTQIYTHPNTNDLKNAIELM